MNNQFALPRIMLAYGMVVVAALVVGYLLATPTALLSLAGVAMVLGFIAFPLLMRWHYPLLVFSWNASLIIYLLPGQPSLGAMMAAVSLFFHVLNRSLRREVPGTYVRSVAWSLIFLAIVTVGTAVLTGGIAGRSLGSEMWGAKRYLGVLGAIAGYFALVSQRIPPERAQWWVGVFILSALTSVMSNVAYALGPSFYFLFAFFPSESAYLQAVTQNDLLRLPGVTWSALALCYFMMARYGLTGIIDWRRPWRLVLLLALVGLSLLGGFRTAIVVIGLLLAAQFYFEGLLRSRLLPLALGFALVTLTFLMVFMDRLPLSIQRSLSFLPVEVDPYVRADATGTLDWRFEMWRTLLPQVPQYLLLGKGFIFSSTDFLLTQEALRRGLLFNSYEDTLVNGNYHSGILTLIIPFGIWGVIGFVWFCFAAWRVLLRNYRHGHPSLRTINTFLLAFFAARLTFYVIFYGQFDIDLMLFTGTVGFSIALNGLASPASKSYAARPPAV